MSRSFREATERGNPLHKISCQNWILLRWLSLNLIWLAKSPSVLPFLIAFNTLTPLGSRLLLETHALFLKLYAYSITLRHKWPSSSTFLYNYCPIRALLKGQKGRFPTFPSSLQYALPSFLQCGIWIPPPSFARKIIFSHIDLFSTDAYI